MATRKIPQYAIYHKFVIYCQIIFISHLHLYGQQKRTDRGRSICGENKQPQSPFSLFSNLST